MKRHALILLTLLMTGAGCTEQPKAPMAIPAVSWGADQLVVSFAINSLLTVVGENVNVAPVVTKGVPVRFTTSPELPIGLTVNAKTGLISGTVALVQPKTRYSLNCFDATGRSSSVSFYIETRTDVFVKDTSVPEVTTVSGASVDLNRFISGGKGGYRFAPIPASLGVVSPDGIFTPGATIGAVEFRVTDNFGLGSQVGFKLFVGVPRLSVTFTNPVEGTDTHLELTLSGKSSVSTTVNFSIKLNTAMTDSVSTDPGSVTFAPGETKKTIIVKTFNNKVNKDDGTFDVILSLDQNLKFDGIEESVKPFTVTLININPPPLVSFEVASSSFVEFDTTVSFNIKLDRASSKEIKVSYSLDKLSSTVQPYDHNLVDGFVTFQPRTATASGETLKTVSFKVFHDVNGNQVASPDRSMVIRLLNPVFATLGQYTRHTILITDPLVIEVSGEVFDFVLLDALQARGWNRSQNVLVRILSAGVLRSSSQLRGAFSSGFVDLTYPTKIALVNKGKIIGHGGEAGLPTDPTLAAYNNFCNQQISGNAGGKGGPAIATVIPMTLVNEGDIFGGAGGGGSGVSAVIGSDANCNTKSKLFGGKGGQGADANFTDFNLPEAGSEPSVPTSSRPYLSTGGSGGLPGEPGGKGLNPDTLLSADALPGPGGLPGVAISDSGPNGSKLVNILKTCRFFGGSVDKVEYNVASTCNQKYQEMVAANQIQSGLTVSEVVIGNIKGSAQ